MVADPPRLRELTTHELEPQTYSQPFHSDDLSSSGESAATYVAVPEIASDALCGLEAPDLKRIVLTTRRCQSSIGRYRHTADRRVVTLENVGVLECREVPDPDESVFSHRNGPCTVRGECGVVDATAMSGQLADCLAAFQVS